MHKILKNISTATHIFICMLHVCHRQKDKRGYSRNAPCAQNIYLRFYRLLAS